MAENRAFRRLEGTVFERAKVAKLRCLVVGVGAVGSEIARILGQIGIAEVGLVDMDHVEPVNGPHSIFFSRTRFGGQPKPEVVAEQAAELFSGTVWTPYPCEIADLPLLEARRFDLLFAAPDSAQARMETAYLARRLKRPMLDAALMGTSWWRGRVSWFPSTRGAACYLCGYGESKRAQLLQATVSAAPGCSRQIPAPELASTPVMSTVVAGIAVDAGLRGLFGENGSSGTRQSYALDVRLEGAGSNVTAHQLTQSAACPWHEEMFGEMFGGTLQYVRFESPTLREALIEQGLAALELEWPMVIRALCMVCGQESETMERVARFRRKAVCAACGSRRLLPLQTVTAIHRKDALAEHAPGDLGLAHLWLGTVQREDPAATLSRANPKQRVGSSEMPQSNEQASNG